MDIQIMSNEQGHKIVLEVLVGHRNGRYILYVTQCELDGCWRTSVLCADGNFCTTLEYGRKSNKKLDRYNHQIVDNAGLILELWQKEKYRDIVDLVKFISPVATNKGDKK